MSSNLRILIVDDDKIWADFSAKKLSRDNLVIEVSYEVSDALRKIEENLYDIIFCDIKMKYTDQKGVTNDDGGFLISGRVRSHLPQARMIMVTAFDSSAMAVKSLHEKKTYYYLPKADDPQIDILQMRQLIAQVMQESREIAPNPFFAQVGQTPRFLMVNRAFNEKKEMDFLVQCLEFAGSRNLARFLVLGKLGSGKSCLLLHYKRYLQKNGVWTSYYKIPPPMTENSSISYAADLLLGILDGFPNLDRTDFRHFFEGIKKIGVKINAYLVQGQLEWERKEVLPSVSKLLDSGLKHLFTDLAERSTISAVFLDDIHYLKNFPEILSNLIEIFASARLVHQPIILGCSCLTLKNDFFTIHPDLDQTIGRFFSGNIFSLQDFTKEEVKELVFQTLSGTGVMMEDGIIDLIYESTNGNPYATQLILHNLYENQINGLVKSGYFSKAFKDSLKELHPFFQNLYGSLSQEEETVAALLASSGPGPNLSRLRLLLVEKEMDDLLKSLPQLLDSMEKRDLLSKSKDGTYFFKHAMYQLFLKSRV
jgi:ActR/RegA family two-component response regulator